MAHLSQRSNYSREKGAISTESDYLVHSLNFKSSDYAGIISFGELDVMFIDSNYNLSPPKSLISKVVSKTLMSEDNYNQETLRSLLLSIDEEFLRNDKISRCVVAVWTSRNGEKIICKAGGQMDCFSVFDSGWDNGSAAFVELLVRTASSERDFFVGSGAALPMTAEMHDKESLVVVTSSLPEHLRTCGYEWLEFLTKYGFHLLYNEDQFLAYTHQKLNIKPISTDDVFCYAKK